MPLPKKTLTGTASFSFTDGALQDTNIAETIRNAKTKVLGGGTGSLSTGAKKTDFSELSGSFDVNNGFVTNEDLAFKSPLLRIKGNRNADLPSETIDYHASTTIVATTQGPGGDDLKELVVRSRSPVMGWTSKRLQARCLNLRRAG